MRRGQDRRSLAAVNLELSVYWKFYRLSPAKANDILRGGPHLRALITFLVRHEENILLAKTVDIYSSGI